MGRNFHEESIIAMAEFESEVKGCLKQVVCVMQLGVVSAKSWSLRFRVRLWQQQELSILIWLMMLRPQNYFHIRNIISNFKAEQIDKIKGKG
jgi:hypothetical protein